MQLNVARKYEEFTEGGSPAALHLTPLQELRRAVMSCLLWEDQFYESGESVGDRIKSLVAKTPADQVAEVAVEARSVHNLRHVPLLLAASLAKHGGSVVGRTIEQVVQRPDELAEFLSIYWSINPADKGKAPLSAQVKKGLARAFNKFNAYSLAKYNRDREVKLRDVMFLTHPKPEGGIRGYTKDTRRALKAEGLFRQDLNDSERLFAKLVDGAMEIPDTWETELSAGKDKKTTFERLLSEDKLGYLALLRNLRNMTEVGVDTIMVRQAILERKGARRVLPFRYVAAARACPQLEPFIDQALSEAISEMPVLPGKTAVLVDVSGSMSSPLSGKSDLTRLDAACALASLIHGDVRMFSFSDRMVEVPPRRGMAGVDALMKSQAHSGTALASAVHIANTQIPCDRLIVITDEQATDGRVPAPAAKRAYMVNVASYRNGVGYGPWTHIDGFSEGVLRWIHAVENDA